MGFEEDLGFADFQNGGSNPGFGVQGFRYLGGTDMRSRFCTHTSRVALKASHDHMGSPKHPKAGATFLAQLTIRLLTGIIKKPF